MRPQAIPMASVVACLALMCVLTTLSAAAAPPQQSLDPALAAYTAGDVDVVPRTFARSDDFRKHRVLDGRRLERWLGSWSPAKAEFLLEVLNRAGDIAPAYLGGVALTGQRYVTGRPSPLGMSAREDELERRFHLIAVGLMQRRIMGTQILDYVNGLRSRRPPGTSAAVWDPRLDLARGIGQEQVCRKLHATARHDRVLAELEGAAATPPAERQVAIECMQMALGFLEAASTRAEVRDEARTRAGFAAFQLGKTVDAREALDGARADADRTLGYWRALFRGRVADALGSDDDAERAYREALGLFPDAQSARIGLALTLFRLHRDDDADVTVREARRVPIDAVDPWDKYFEGDARFVADWMTAMRKARQ